MNRETDHTLNWYLEQWKKNFNGSNRELTIQNCTILKENVKGFSNDTYAIGNRYLIEGFVIVPDNWNKHDIKFQIFHSVRNDYHCAFPVKFNSITL